MLGIGSPWQVKKADLDVAARKVEILVEHDAATTVACPQCGAKCPRHDHAPERTWRDLDVMQFTTLIRAKVPRANFAAATRQACPQAAIVHDRFHVSMHLNEGVDKVRREERRRLLERGDTSLTGTKFLWLQGASPEGERALTFDELCQRNLKTARAWCHKETFAEFWGLGCALRGERFFNQWYNAIARSKLEPLKTVAPMLKAHLLGLLTYFEHPITNALTEGFNSRIQAIKADARGFRNFANYRVRILFHCGKLDLQPVIPTQC